MRNVLAGHGLTALLKYIYKYNKYNYKTLIELKIFIKINFKFLKNLIENLNYKNLYVLNVTYF
jgi:hypothetical protein